MTRITKGNIIRISIIASVVHFYCMDVWYNIDGMISTIHREDCKQTLLTRDANQYIQDMVSAVPTQPSPICVINIGGIASGKTTVSRVYIQDYLKQPLQTFCDINPDNVLARFYENNVNCYGKKQNSPYQVIHSLFHAAVKHRCHILYDTTGINTKDIRKKMKTLTTHGYTVYFCVCIIDDIRIALKRLVNRAQKTGRQVDQDHFIQRYHDLPIALQDFYFRLPPHTYQEISIFNTSGKKPKLINVVHGTTSLTNHLRR